MYVATLREVAQQRNASLSESSVLVGEHASVFGSKGRESDEEDDTRDEEGTAFFSSSWLPGKDSKAEPPKDVKKKGRKRKTERQDQVAMDEDIVQEVVLSSDEDDGSLSDTFSAGEDGSGETSSLKAGKQELLRSWKARSRNALQITQRILENLKQKGQRRERRLTEENYLVRPPVGWSPLFCQSFFFSTIVMRMVD